MTPITFEMAIAIISQRRSLVSIIEPLKFESVFQIKYIATKNSLLRDPPEAKFSFGRVYVANFRDPPEVLHKRPQQKESRELTHNPPFPIQGFYEDF